MKFKIITPLILHFLLFTNLSAYEIVIDKSSSNKEIKFIDNILYPNKTKYEVQSSSNEYYYYPKSEQDCYSRGMKPFNAANGSLICSGSKTATSSYRRQSTSSNGYYYYPTSKQDCYSRGLKPIYAANGSLICGK